MNLDENEFIELYEYSFGDLIDMIMENKNQRRENGNRRFEGLYLFKRNNIL